MAKALTLEEKQNRVRALRPIDDVFFEVLASNKAVCQEILQTILEDKALTVEDVIVQSSERNLYGRSVRLDALCRLGNGAKCNIEVQRSDDDDHVKRVRFNASSITVRESVEGDRFKDVIELYVIYISEHDFFQGGKSVYHMDKVLRETNAVVDDGLHEVFVNCAVQDGTDIAGLMQCFLQTQVEDPRFPEMSAEVRRLKRTEGGVSAVCKVMQQYEEIARTEGRAEGRIEGRVEGIQEKAKQVYENCLARGMSIEDAVAISGYEEHTKNA